MKKTFLLFLISCSACYGQTTGHNNIGWTNHPDFKPDSIYPELKHTDNNPHSPFWNGDTTFRLTPINYDSLYGRFGATPLPSWNYPFQPMPMPSFPLPYFLPNPPVASSVRIITIEDFIQYAEECWNDSALQWSSIETYVDSTLPPLADNESYFRRHDTYIHRKPSFEGFVEWLKKK